MITGPKSDRLKACIEIVLKAVDEYDLAIESDPSFDGKSTDDFIAKALVDYGLTENEVEEAIWKERESQNGNEVLA